MGLSRQEYWSGLSCPPPGDLLDSSTEPMSLNSSALTGGFFTTSTNDYRWLTIKGEKELAGKPQDLGRVTKEGNLEGKVPGATFKGEIQTSLTCFSLLLLL